MLFKTTRLRLKRCCRVRTLNGRKYRYVWIAILLAFFIYLIYYCLRVFVSQTVSPSEYDGLLWGLTHISHAEDRQEDVRLNPPELVYRMMAAQRKLMVHIRMLYDVSEISLQDFIGHYAANLFYFQQFFRLATIRTSNGLKHFIDLSDKNKKCIGISLDVDGNWKLEPHIVRLNPNCQLLAFGKTDESNHLVSQTGNSVFEKAILTYEGRISNADDSNYKQISLLKFLDRDFNMSTIDFFQGNDAENGFELLRFFSENQHLATPICQINIPVGRGKLSHEEFTKELKKVVDNLILQGTYFLMHIKEVQEKQQWNFFLVNTLYDECLKQLFPDPINS